MKKKVAYLGIYLTLALVCSYIESLIPFYFGVPGMKLGLANLVIVFTLYRMGAGDAFLLSVLRVLISGFAFGNGFSILYSLSGAILSFLVMFFFYKVKRFKTITVSVIGGIFHNVGQLLMAALLVENYDILYYLPVLLIAGFITGLLIGVVASEILLRVQRR